jgi:hypothetical protein
VAWLLGQYTRACVFENAQILTVMLFASNGSRVTACCRNSGMHICGNRPLFGALRHFKNQGLTRARKIAYSKRFVAAMV